MGFVFGILVGVDGGVIFNEDGGIIELNVLVDCLSLIGFLFMCLM